MDTGPEVGDSGPDVNCTELLVRPSLQLTRKQEMERLPEDRSYVPQKRTHPVPVDQRVGIPRFRLVSMLVYALGNLPEGNHAVTGFDAHWAELRSRRGSDVCVTGDSRLAQMQSRGAPGSFHFGTIG